MHLSMLSPRVRIGGEGRAELVELDIFTWAKVKLPTPGHLVDVKFPTLGNLFCPIQVLVIIMIDI